MGAWGVTALENDEALDTMATLTHVKSTSAMAKRIESMLGSRDGAKATLAAALVDNAANGHDVKVLDITWHGEYVPVLNLVYSINARRFAAKAIKAVDKQLTPAALNTWHPNYRAARRDMLTHLRWRLARLTAVDELLGR